MIRFLAHANARVRVYFSGTFFFNARALCEYRNIFRARNRDFEEERACKKKK